MFPAEQAHFLAQHLIANIESESQVTRKVLAAVPDDQAHYRPEEKSKTAFELAWHIASVEVWFLESVAAGAFSDPSSLGMPVSKPSEVVAWYDAHLPAALAKARTRTGDQLAQIITFYTFQLPAVLYLNFAMVHTVHHRGQLSVYLRPMGSKVPSIYGGSADEPFEMAASS